MDPSSTRLEKFEAFRRLHERPGVFLIPNPWDAGSARILTAVGYEALATTSAGFAFSMGTLDLPSCVSRAQVLGNARAIVDATHLPVSADLANGYGDAPQDCAETIRLAAAVGLVGGSIEDATGDGNSPIYDFEHSVERVAAASEAARSLHFLLVGRAENFLWGRPDLDDTIRRLNAFSAAGANVLFAPGLPSLEAIRTVCSSVDKPVNVVMGLKSQPYTVEDLQDAGVRRISVGSSFARAALAALLRAAREVKGSGTFDYSADALPSAEVSKFMSDVTRPGE